MDRDSDPVLQDVKKQTQLTTAAGIAVGVVNNQHVQLSEGAKYFLFSTSRPELGPQQPVAYPGILFGGRGGVNKVSWGQRTERTGIWGR